MVIGGSLGGLAAGIALREAGWEAEVFERSWGELEGRGAGIVVQPELLSFLEERRTVRSEVGVPAEARQYLDPDGRVVRVERRRQLMTSWGKTYTHLRALFPEECYHRGKELVEFEWGGDGVVARFGNGGEEECDLLVGADGTHSVCRRLLLPAAVPEYAGYVAWRGLVREGDLEPSLERIFSRKFT
ncbi:MAG: FAD-dependent oxidoreductase, partial [Actinobacteria bacterium]